MGALAAISTHDAAVLLAVVGARLIIPLFIFRYPLPAILAAMVIDAADQSIFQQATSLDLTGYQSYDKALDVYYLAIAYTASMRNWASPFTFQVSAFLWYYRLIGVAAFELTQARWLLLVFPNTFEYFFDAIEAIRLRWDPGRLTRRTIVLIAAGIWIFIKLPQEWWIHIAQLDTTDLIKEQILGVPADTPWGTAFAENPWVYGVIVILVVVVFLLVRFIRRRLPPGLWATSFRSDTVNAHLGWLPTGPEPRRTQVLTWSLAEKVVLVGLTSVIFFTVYPDSEAGAPTVFLVAALTVVVNAAVAHVGARTGHLPHSALGLFAATFAVNIASLVLFANLATGAGTPVSIRDVAFFALLIAVLLTCYERARRHRLRCEGGATLQPAG